MPTSRPKINSKERRAYIDALRMIQACKRQKSEILDLSKRRLTAIPPEIGQLSALKEFSLADNQITSLPPQIGKLSALTALYISNNQLTSLTPEIGQLSALTQLSLQNNHLKSLPQEIGKLSALKKIWLDGNPSLRIPSELTMSGDAKKVLDYYFRTNDPGEALPLNEFKLILVGRGGVGKTTLVEKLVTDEFVKFEKTPGIKITQWPVKIGREEVRAHVWDFGGQEIMHGTHRFFMTERALYIVLITGREGTEDQDAEYWLSLIRSFAGHVPVLMLLHKWSEQKFELNRELLREKYGKNVTFLETDSGETPKQAKNITKLRELICQEAARMPGLKAKWPKAWREVKQKLPAQKRSWMTYPTFQKFCAAHGVPNAEDQEALSGSLHELGLMLAYRKDETLRAFGVLHPTWVTDGIYRMLNDERLQERRGRFHLSDFAAALPKKEYPAELHPYLLALMQKFRLCFPLDDDGKEYLIPELLSKREPELDGEFSPDTSLCFTYQYDTVLPEGLLPRFIVETHVQRETKHAWKTGVVLERDNCRALVRGDLQGRKITLRVTGPGGGRRELLGIIREHFERIHRDFTKLPVTELVPVPGHPEVVLDYHELLIFERDNVAEIVKVVAGRSVKMKVKDLLDGVDVEGAVRYDHVEFSRALIPHDRALSPHDKRLFMAMEFSPKVFISYSRVDSRYLEQLRFALVPYERKAGLTVWADPLIEPGQEWREEIFNNLDHADIFILLLSPRSVASDFVIDKELPRAEARRKAGECEIIPIVIKPCGWKQLGLSELQVALPGGKAISEAKNRDAAWQKVMDGLDKVIARIKAKQEKANLLLKKP